MQHGQHGFAYQVPQPTGLVAATYKSRQLWSTTDKPMGTTWGIHLAAWTGGNGNRNATGLRPAGCRAVITWGGGATDGGSGVEIATVDYPMQGAEFMVHGSNVLVEIIAIVSNNTVTDVSPMLAGWLTEGQAHPRERAATLTEALATLGAGSGQSFNVPARARAYRLMAVESIGAPNAITGLQLTGNATPRTVQNDLVFDGSNVPVESAQASNRAAWFPLSPEAASLVISNPGGNGVATVGVQWLIELG